MSPASDGSAARQPSTIALEPPLPWVALGCFVLWALLACLDAQIAFARSEIRLAIDILAWSPGAGLFPSLLGVVLLGAAAGLRRHGARGFGRLACLAALLILIRLLSLWQPVGASFPVLGILWSPHASWALAASVLVVLLPTLRSARGLVAIAHRLTPAWLAGAIFVLCTVVYGSWAVYVSQMTMVHGDEAHYLLVTQSLLRDGDIDLQNNGTREDIAEFRMLPFELHRAPSSPAGTTYSVHPPGLSALLLPAYAAGVTLWHNPRLSCYLFMAVVSAAVLSLLYLWLTRLGFGRWQPLVPIAIIGTVAPTAFFSVQLYPDFPAILVAVVVLLLLPHWQVAGRSRVDISRHEPLAIFGLALALGALPLLHPRFAPLSVLLGALLLLQAHTSSRRRLSLGALAVAVLLCGGLLVGYNIAVADDWLGHMRPGNAWDDEALKLSTWGISLPGHWLHETKGVVANAPVLLLAFVGAGRLLRQLDRRLLVAAALYGATVVVNGMHPDWTFGFGMPARFMMSGIPAMAILLCSATAFLLRRVSSVFLAAILLAMSWDTLGPLFAMPTMAYDGEHLFLRSIARFYPLMAHLTPGDAVAMSMADSLLWLSVLFALVGIGHGFGRTWRLVLTCSIAAIAPVIWGWVPTSAARLMDKASPFLLALSDDDPDLRGFPVRHAFDLETYRVTTGAQQTDGLRAAEAQSHSPGLLASHYLPFQRRGVHEVTVNDYVVEGDGSHSDHVVFTRRQTLPAVQRWETRHYFPIDRAEGLFRRPYIVEDHGLGYLYFPFSGQRNMTVGQVDAAFHPVPVQTVSHPLERLTPVTADTMGTTSYVGVERIVERGRYRARFVLGGNTWRSLLEPHPVPVLLAVIAAPPQDVSNLQRLAERWFHEDRRLMSVFADTELVRPLVERLQAPWWMHIPGGGGAFDLVFSVPEQRRIRLLLRYEGPETLILRHVSLFEEQVLP
jgi:hypothetical protein